MTANSDGPTGSTGTPGTNERSPILELDGVGQTFGSVTVLDGIALEIRSGELTAIVGPNGSGKTTLLRVLAGLLDPTTGEITYNGPQTARERGYLPQHPDFRSGFTVSETMEFYTALVGADPTPLLERVGLGDAGSRRIEQLSGGMVRLLGVAQATVGDPPVVLLDEPGSGLDPGMRTRIAEVSAELATAGRAVVFTAHDLSLVEEWADRVVVIDSGSIAADGVPGALRAEFDAPDMREVFDRAVSGPTDTVEVTGVSDR